MKNPYKLLFIITAISLIIVVANDQNQFSNEDMIESYNIGYKKALSLDKPSEDLEITCAALWLRENDKRIDNTIHKIENRFR